MNSGRLRIGICLLLCLLVISENLRYLYFDENRLTIGVCKYDNYFYIDSSCGLTVKVIKRCNHTAEWTLCTAYATFCRNKT